MTAGIKGFFQTGVTVADLDASIRFYRDVLGFTLILGPTPPSGGDESSRAVGVPGATLRLAVFRTGGGELELLECVTPPSPVAKRLPLNTLGAEHVAFRVAR
jgi:catechol 2,3-dioxygenase-like lactoylglutathione lyase family enzyme